MSSLSAAVPLSGEGCLVLSTGGAGSWTEQRLAGNRGHHTWMGNRGLIGGWCGAAQIFHRVMTTLLSTEQTKKHTDNANEMPGELHPR